MMEFWKISVFNKETNKEESFLVQAPYKAPRIIEILSEVHPEYENIRAKKTKKPPGMKVWESQ